MRLLRLLLTTLVCCLALVPVAAGAQTYTSVVVFGDSLSDTGNFAQLAFSTFGTRYPAPAFNYADGRFTDSTATTPAARGYTGVWVEQLTAQFAAKPAVKDSLDGGTNYAYGSATTASGTRTVSLGGGLSLSVPNMGMQVDTYLATNPRPSTSTLYVLFGGGNDLFADPSAAGVATAARQETALVQQLVNIGATDFLVPNLPPLGAIPQYNQTASAATLNAASAMFRMQLAIDLQALAASNAAQGNAIRIYQPDLYTLETNIGANPYTYGFASVTTAAQGMAATLDPDTYAFWDGIHPTTAGHTEIAALARTQFNQPNSTTTALSITPAQTVAGQPITLTATLTASAGAATLPAGGSVTFFIGTGSAAVALGAAPLVNGTTATLTVAAPAASGSPYSVTAVYVGDAAYAGSVSAARSLTVQSTAVPTATTLTASATTVNPGAAVTFTAGVTSSNGAPTGTVVFTTGSTQLGSAMLSAGVATLTTTALPTGTDSVIATYQANGIYATSSSPAVTVVVASPAVAVSLAPGSITLARGAGGTVQVTLTPAGGATGAATLSCANLPAHLGCAFSPASVTLGGTAQTSTLTLSTTASAALHVPRLMTHQAGDILWTLVGLPLLLRRRRVRQAGLWLLVIAAAATLGFAGCGSGSSSGASTVAAGSYTITVSSSVAGNAALNSSTSLTVVVQ